MELTFVCSNYFKTLLHHITCVKNINVQKLNVRLIKIKIKYMYYAVCDDTLTK